VAENFFGDTYAQETRGPLSIDAQYGAVELQQIDGPVSVRMTGEFPLRAVELANGGAFDLSGAVAEFRGVEGELRVRAFQSAVTVAALPMTGTTDVASESGSVRFVLPEQLDPDIAATVIYGDLVSALSLNRTEQPSRVLGRRSSQTNGHRIRVRSVFGGVAIETATAAGQPAPPAPADTDVYNDTVALTEPADDVTQVVLRAIAGDLTVEPSATGVIEATATRAVWVEQALDAPRALEAMELQLDRTGETVTLQTLTTGTMADYGASRYQMNVRLQLPPGVGLRVESESGDTRVSGVSAPLDILQQAGQIRVTDCTGAMNISNQSGGIVASNCTREATISARFGDVEVRRQGGPLEVRCIEGRTIVDGPGDALVVRNNGGDVKILTLDGVRGDYDIRAEDADVNMLLDPFAHASLTLVTQEGQVFTGHPLRGSIEHNRRQFTGRLNDGTHEIRLETVRGDIILD